MAAAVATQQPTSRPSGKKPPRIEPFTYYIPASFPKSNLKFTQNILQGSPFFFCDGCIPTHFWCRSLKYIIVHSILQRWKTFRSAIRLNLFSYFCQSHLLLHGMPPKGDVGCSAAAGAEEHWNKRCILKNE